jgi:tRNA 2-(methylsulfanyl)-N6-isopentenyladenosine37 hydroxylase
MLGLKLKTDPHWANIAESNLEEILSDHCWCEQKGSGQCTFYYNK